MQAASSTPTNNVMNWSEIDRCLLICGLNLLMYLEFLIWTKIITLFPEHFTDVNQEVAHSMQVTLLWLFVAGSIATAIAYYIKLKALPTERFRDFLIFFFGFPYVWFAYHNGLTGLATGLYTLAIGVIGLFLFPHRIVIQALAVCITLLIALMIGTTIGSVPVSGLYVDYPLHTQSTTWLVTQFLLNVPMLMIVLYMISGLLNGLKEREDQIRQLSRIDELTQTWNRRYLFEQFEREINLALRDESPLAFIILDLDYFKKINDTFGHQTGDKILRDTAAVLKTSIRKTDILGRYGGEEFAIVLPNCDDFTARKIAERCRQEIERIIISPNPMCQKHLGQPMSASASFGVASYNVRQISDTSGEPTIENIIERADQALYSAKKTGRNRVAFAS